MADGGSINLRLSLKGAEQVRAELDKIGPAGSKMGRELDRAMRVPGPGLKALDVGVNQARGGLEGLAGRLGPVGSGMAGLGAAGLAVAGGIAAAVIAAGAAVQQASEAMRFADDLEDAAGKINIGVEALQEWRFAAAEAGATAADADSAIDGFQKKLGEAMAGGRSVKWFERLGFSAADLKEFKGTEDALDAVIDKIAGLGTEAERAAVAEKLGLGPLVPLVRQGSDAIDDMRARARELGIVMDEEMVKRGAAASREMEVLSQKIDMQLKQAFIDMGPVLIQIMGLVGQLASALNNVANSFKRVEDRSTDYLERQNQRLRQQQIGLLNRSRGGTVESLSPSERTVWNNLTESRGSVVRELRDRQTNAPPPPAPDVPAVTLRDVSGGGRGGGVDKAAQEAERRERERQRLYEQLDREMLSTRRDVTRERWNDDTSADRAQLAKSMYALERQERDAKLAEMEAELQRVGGLDERRRLLLDQIRAMNVETDAAQDAAIIETQRKEHAEAMRAAEEAHLDITAEILGIAASQARTSDERREIELSLLELAQRRQRADLEAAIEAEKEPEARARLVEALGRLPALFEAQARAVDRQNANPVRRWQDAQFQSGAEASEWLQGEALDALDGVNAGLRDAWKNAESAGDAFKRMGDVAVDALGRVVDALLEVAVQRLLIEPLVGAMFGDGQTAGGSGGGGGLLGNFLKNVVGSMFGGGGQQTPMFGGGSMGNPPSILSLKSLPRKARGGLHSAAGRVLLGEYGMETADLPIGSRIYDTDRTERTLLDFDNRLRTRAGGAGGQPIVNLTANVINKTSEPVQAKMKQTPKGLDIILEPAVRAGVARMASDGSLDRVQGLRPKPIKR